MKRKATVTFTFEQSANGVCSTKREMTGDLTIFELIGLMYINIHGMVEDSVKRADELRGTKRLCKKSISHEYRQHKEE